MQVIALPLTIYGRRRNAMGRAMTGRSLTLSFSRASPAIVRAGQSLLPLRVPEQGKPSSRLALADALGGAVEIGDMPHPRRDIRWDRPTTKSMVTSCFQQRCQCLLGTAGQDFAQCCRGRWAEISEKQRVRIPTARF